MMLGKKKELVSIPHSIYKYIMDRNVKPKPIKILWGNRIKILWHSVSQKFIGYNTKSTTHKATNWSIRLHQTLKLLFQEIMWREWKDKPREDWRNSAKKVCDKEPVFRIYRELLKLNNNKTQLKKRAGGSGWGRHVNSRTFHFNVWQNSLQI